jgi:hypothetical protein
MLAAESDCPQAAASTLKILFHLAVKNLIQET